MLKSSIVYNVRVSLLIVLPYKKYKMKLIGKKGIPTDVFDGNPAISNDKLILVNGRFKRGNYSYATKKWFWIEEFKCIIDELEGDDELIWFDIEK